MIKKHFIGNPWHKTYWSQAFTRHCRNQRSGLGCFPEQSAESAAYLPCSEETPASHLSGWSSWLFCLDHCTIWLQSALRIRLHLISSSVNAVDHKLFELSQDQNGRKFSLLWGLTLVVDFSFVFLVWRAGTDAGGVLSFLSCLPRVCSEARFFDIWKHATNLSTVLTHPTPNSALC